MFATIISGGQTGVDRAALDVALQRGIPCGGWCPPGRAAEDGPLAAAYPVVPTPADTDPEAPDIPHSQRTAWNVRDADGTLVLLAGPTGGEPDRGTALTLQLAARYGKPCLVLDLAATPSTAAVGAWARVHHVRVLNVAGPRESHCPGIYARAVQFLRCLL